MNEEISFEALGTLCPLHGLWFGYSSRSYCGLCDFMDLVCFVYCFGSYQGTHFKGLCCCCRSWWSCRAGVGVGVAAAAAAGAAAGVGVGAGAGAGAGVVVMGEWRW